MSRRYRHLQIFITLAFISEILYLFIASLGNLRESIPAFLLCFGLIFIIYFFAAFHFFGVAEKQTGPGRVVGQHKDHRFPANGRGVTNLFSALGEKRNLFSRQVLVVGIAFGILFRLSMLFTTPSLSDDIYRYIWDGKTASNGINPYQYAPQASELDGIKDTTIYPNVNHKEVPTVYPPVSQFVFRGLFSFSPSVMGFKAGFIIFDLLTMFVLLLILKALSMNLNRLLLYVWNPLVIVEISGSGHADIIGIFLLTLSLYFLVRKQFFRSNIMLALSFLTKFISVLFLPVIMFVNKKRKIGTALLFILLAALLYVPFADAGKQLFAGFLTYTDKWEFNDSVFPILVAFYKHILPEGLVTHFMIIPDGLRADAQTVQTRTLDLALLVSKATVAFLFAGLYGYFIMQLKNMFRKNWEMQLFHIGLIFIGMFIVLNPTVHPWYLCWIVPFLVIFPQRAWLLLTGLVVLAYWILIDYANSGIWQENILVKWIEYFPFYALLLFDFFKQRYFQKRQTKKLTLEVEF